MKNITILRDKYYSVGFVNDVRVAVEWDNESCLLGMQKHLGRYPEEGLGDWAIKIEAIRGLDYLLDEFDGYDFPHTVQETIDAIEILKENKDLFDSEEEYNEAFGEIK